MNKYSKIIAVLLVLALVMSGAGIATAYEESTPKQEVIYANMDCSGKVEKLYAVNIFNMSEAGEIIDYGDYSSVRNLNRDYEISRTGDTVKINAEKGKTYYEGILNSSMALPWKVKIKYYLDGSEAAAEDLAGAEGHLEISMDITENTKCKGSFFDSCGLQVSMTLDTERCDKIKAEGATSANMGSYRQLTYLILPGEGCQIMVEADVSDFEMDEIMINGLPLGMEIDFSADDSKAIQDKLNDLKDGAGELDDAASDIKKGASELKKGAGELAEGLDNLTQQNQGILEGAYSVFVFMTENVQDEINTSLASMGVSISLTPENYEETLAELAAQLPEGNPAAENIAAVKAQLDSYKAFYEGLSRYTKGTALAAAAGESVAAGALKLAGGTADLKEGTGELADSTSDIDKTLEDEINKAINEMMGRNFKVRSFVSRKNTSVESVQFVMKTSAIRKAEIKEEKPEQAEKSFIDRLLDLFR